MKHAPPEPLQWSDAQIAAFWRYVAEHRSEDYFTRQFGARILDLTRRFCTPHALVCDYGCGPGYLLEQLLRSHRAAGCDLSDDSLAEARRRLAGHANFAGLFSVEALPAGLRFDVAYAVETVEHVLERHEEGFFANLSRLLRPRGVIIATTPNAENLAADTVFCAGCSHTFHRWQHVRSFDAATLEGFFARRGFEALSVTAVDFAARAPLQRLVAALRPALGGKNPHLVYVGRSRS